MENCAEVLASRQYELGEGPIWSSTFNRLSWVDILGQKICYYDFAQNILSEFLVGEVIGFAIPTVESDWFLTGQLNQIVLQNIKTKDKKVLASVDEDRHYNRFNDAKCDALGRLWAGTTTSRYETSKAGLYKVLPNGSCEKVLSDIGCSNGLCWSADHRTMYYIDSTALSLYAFPFDLEEGQIGKGEVILQWPKAMGYLDGMTIDVEDKLWIALWGGGGVIRFCPQQKVVLENIVVSAKHTSSVTFGGKEMRTLFITSARVGLTLKEIHDNPLEGSVFVYETKTKGVPANISSFVP